MYNIFKTINIGGTRMITESDSRLTKREKEILDFICNGYTNIEISNTLKLSPNTVKVHVKHIYQKIDVTNRTEAIIWKQEIIYQRNLISKPLVIIDNFLENSNVNFLAKKNFFYDLQENILQIFSCKELINAGLKSSLYGINELQENYLVNGSIKNIGKDISLSIHLQTYPNNYHIWNNTYIVKQSNTARALAAQITASVIYHIVEKEIRHQNSINLPEKSIFQKNIAAFQLIYESTNTSIETAQNILDNILVEYPYNITGLYSRCVASYISILLNYSKNPKNEYIIFEKYCKKLTQLSRHNAKAYYVRGLYSLLQKDHQKALNFFLSSLSIDPSFQESYFIVAQIYALSGDSLQAKKYLYASFKLCDDYKYRGNNLIAIGVIFFCLKEYDKAVNFLEENFCIRANNSFEILLYICCLYLSGNKEKAQKLAKNIKITDDYLKTLLRFINDDLSVYIRKIFRELDMILY